MKSNNESRILLKYKYRTVIKVPLICFNKLIPKLKTLLDTHVATTEVYFIFNEIAYNVVIKFNLKTSVLQQFTLKIYKSRYFYNDHKTI